MLLKKSLPSTAAILLDFTKPQQVHNYPRADAIKKSLPSTAAILLDFTKPQPVHNYPRADASKKILAVYSSNSPRLHKAPTSSQLSKSGCQVTPGLPKSSPASLEVPSRLQVFLGSLIRPIMFGI